MNKEGITEWLNGYFPSHAFEEHTRRKWITAAILIALPAIITIAMILVIGKNPILSVVTPFAVIPPMFFFIYTTWWSLENRRKVMNLPYLVLLNPLNGRINSAGKMIKIVDNVELPFLRGTDRTFQCVKTNRLFLVPPVMDGDIIVKTTNKPQSILNVVVAEIIASRSGYLEDVNEKIARWINIAFPGDNNVDIDVDAFDNFVLIRPIPKDELLANMRHEVKASLRSKIGELAGLGRTRG